MGGKKRKKWNKPRDRPKGGDANDGRGERKPYKDIVRENEDFIKYYKAQNLMSDEEWPAFLESMKSDLPTAFRITGSSKENAARLLEIVRGEFFARLVNPSSVEGGECEPSNLPFPLPWYPNELGWQVKLSRKDIRRSEDYYRLHYFLTKETECGAISRQETVSMIPPLVLDVQPHHKVLDMCAAPGSKTAQLIESLHSGGDDVPDGFVIANDVANNRCYMLVHQAKRLNSPCIAITNHDSSSMPNFVRTGEGGKSETIQFDRILCDVPCSGDGTLRKNPDIWAKWNTANANNLHGVQYRIVKRGLQMLAVGGRLVYSTCSLNPVENEAVIARILSETGDSVELVDASERLPGLKFVRGLETWKPASKDIALYSTFEEVDEKWRTLLRPSMFPPLPGSGEKKVPFEKCLRILPHAQDTGCFFVAVLEKKKEEGGTAPPCVAAAPSEGGEPASGGDDHRDSQEAGSKEGRRHPPHKRRKTFHGYKEDPYVFFKPDEPVWKSIKEFYEIGDGLDPTCFLCRCFFGKKKNIYFVAPKLKEAIVANQSSLKIINTGVKVFARCDNKSMGCSFRLVQEGLESIKKFIGSSRRVQLPKEEFVKILYQTDPTNPLNIDQLSEETKKRMEQISQGSCVLDYSGDGLTITVVGWRGNKSVRAYISLPDAIHYLRLLGAPVERFEVNKFKKEDGDKPTHKDGDKENGNPDKSNDNDDHHLQNENPDESNDNDDDHQNDEVDEAESGEEDEAEEESLKISNAA